MPRRIVHVALLCIAAWDFASGLSIAAEARNAIVATVHPIATDAGVKALESGGNAIDAAVAAALTLGVVDGHNSGIGGGCFMLIRTADGQTIALDGRETAPAAATRDMFVRDGKPQTQLSQTGALAVGVPGSVAVYDHAVRRFGKKQLADLLAPAADIAERGFPIDASYAKRLKETSEELLQFPEARQLLFKRNGSLFEEGDTLIQHDLANTYRQIARHGPDYFYKGEFAARVTQWMRDNGGLITRDDFASYAMKQRQPLVTRYRDYTIVGFPPPSSGGVHVAQILNILSKFEISNLESSDPALRVHITAEAMKLAFADRAHWLGDPDFVKVPRNLTDQAYADSLAKRIDPARAQSGVEHGTPTRHEQEVFEKHTTHIAAADAEGNWIALTQTVNTSFGSKVIVPGTGVILNNQMDDFVIQPGVPNYFGLVGSDANAIAPGKRPLSSMSPTIVQDRAGKPFMTLGAAGGPKIISQVVLAISNVIDLGDDVESALKRPRFHHQWSPDVLWVESTFDSAVSKA
jgi:gamma-glutamyltranspeptidase/glutathione hydrolase